MYSNCLLEAVKAKLTNPQQTKVYKRGSWLQPYPHFYWYCKPEDRYYSYCQQNKDAGLNLIQQLCYQGYIIEVCSKGYRLK